MITPVLPDWFPRRELQRPTADQLEKLDNRKQTLTYAGPNEVIPIVYGEQLVGGPIIAGPAVSGANLVWAVALCYSGPEGVERIEDCRVGEAISVLPAITNANTGASAGNTGITIRAFDGRQTLPYSVLTAAISGFDDSFNGIAYACLQVSLSGTFTSLPQVTFRIKGRKCKDPRPATWQTFSLPFNPNDLMDGSATTIVAVGDGGALSTSTAWGTWTSRTSNFGSSNILKIGKLGASQSMIVGEDGKLSTSTGDAQTTWVSRNPQVSTSILRAASKSITSGIVAGDDGAISTSIDAGATWTLRGASLFGGSAIFAVIQSSDRYIVAGEGGKIASSINRTFWVLRDSKFGASDIRCAVHMSDSYSVISDSARVILLGDNGKVSWSSDGDIYNAADSGFGDVSITHAIYANGFLYALSSDGQVRSTINGQLWSAIETSGEFRKMFYAMGNVVAIDSSGQGHRIPVEDLGYVTWTENPVLHMLDFVTNAEFGMGVNLIGAVDAANIADSLYSGAPRSRTGLTIQDSMTEGDALALLSQYAEVMWSYDGRDVAIIPDAPVDQIFPISTGTIIEKTLSMTTVGLDQIPTQIRLLFSDRDEPTWSTRPAVAQVAAHAQHGMPTSPSSVPLPGVFNRIEAERRVWQRLMRLQAPGRLSWQMTAPGMPYQAGDVVRLPEIRGLQSVDVRLIAQPTMVAPLKYQMAGEIYSASQYPDGGSGTVVPNGAIVPYFGPLPAGYEAWSPATGMLVGDATGGQTLAASSGSISLAFSLSGGHAPPSESVERTPSSAGSPSGKFFVSNYSSDQRGIHAHSATVPYSSMLDCSGMEQITFAKRTGGAVAINSGIGFLSGKDLNAERISAVISAVGRYLAVGASRVSRPRRASFGGTTSSSGVHNHGQLLVEAAVGAGNATVFRDTGAHTHEWGAAIDVKFRSRKLALYQATDETIIPIGGIVGWEDGTPPAGWSLCDGTNGTVDLRGFFIELSAPNVAGEIASDVNSINVSSITASGNWSHNHAVQYYSINTTTFPSTSAHSERNEAHSHASESRLLSDVLPVRRTLRFIQYIGV